MTLKTTLLFAALCAAGVAVTGCKKSDDHAKVEQAPAAPVAPAVETKPAAPAPVVQQTALKITDAYMREMPPGAAVAGGFMTITNEAGTDDRLLGVKTAFSPRVEIHETQVVDGVMKMRPVSNGLLIAGHSNVALKPGGNHIMFMNPIAPVKAGDSVEVVLDFEKAPDQTVKLEVRAIGAEQPEMDHSQHMNH